jgi:hypothetical protein
MKIKNTSFTLFRWQEYIWRPGEVLDMGTWPWEEKLAHDLLSKYSNLVEVKDIDEKRQAMLDRLAKARAARKKK